MNFMQTTNLVLTAKKVGHAAVAIALREIAKLRETFQIPITSPTRVVFVCAILIFCTILTNSIFND